MNGTAELFFKCMPRPRLTENPASTITANAASASTSPLRNCSSLVICPPSSISSKRSMANAIGICSFKSRMIIYFHQFG